MVLKGSQEENHDFGVLQREKTHPYSHSGTFDATPTGDNLKKEEMQQNHWIVAMCGERGCFPRCSSPIGPNKNTKHLVLKNGIPEQSRKGARLSAADCHGSPLGSD